MQQMHSKLESIDAVFLLTVQEHTAPLQDQLNNLMQQTTAQFEQINILTTAMTAPYPTSAAAYGAGGSENPWTIDAASGSAGASGSAATATLARVVGGNGLCHCIHLTELAKEAATIKAAMSQADPWKGGKDPWSKNVHQTGGSGDGGDAPGDGPGRGPGGGNGNRAGPGAYPGGPPGVMPTITTQTRLFDEQTAREAQYHYEGGSPGSTWRSDVFDYFISKCPDAEPWLIWVEQQGSTKIESDVTAAKALSGDLMTEISPEVLSHHIWGFLQHCL